MICQTKENGKAIRNRGGKKYKFESDCRKGTKIILPVIFVRLCISNIIGRKFVCLKMVGTMMTGYQEFLQAWVQMSKGTL